MLALFAAATTVPIQLPDLIGLGIPLLVDFVTHTSLSPRYKALVNLALSAVAGVVASAATGHTTWQALAFNATLTYLISVGSYFGWYKPSGVSDKLGRATDGLALFRPRCHKPKPVPAPTNPKGASMTQVAIVNRSTVLDDAAVAAAVPALQQQVSVDFAPVWGADATLAFVGTGATPDPAARQLVILDNADQAGALGYHDLTAAGLPMGKVFAGTDKQYGYNWTVTASHELLELLGDPDVDLCVQGTDAQGGPIFYAFEACDAVEADADGYQIDGVTVSDFVTPAWFTAGEPGPWDHRGLLAAPLQLRPGGYIGVWTPAQGWTQRTAEAQAGYDTRPPTGSRRERRRTGRAQWLRSTAP